MKRFIFFAFFTLILSSILVITSCNKNDDPTDELSNNSNFETGSFTDVRDGKKYKTVKIGNQTWMAENLAYLPSSGFKVYAADSLTKKYGALYTWETANKVAPEGWHLPSEAEWDQLEKFLIEKGYSYDKVTGNKHIAKSLATKNDWKQFTEEYILGGRVGGIDLPELQNKTGFSALPGGLYTLNFGSVFMEIKETGNWWTNKDTTINQLQMYLSRTLEYDLTYLRHTAFNNQYYLSIRCIKNQ